jgi:hypothetical protein
VKKTPTSPGVRRLTRREFVERALATGALFSRAPALLRGQHLNSKLDIAFIGAGGRGAASLRELTVTPGQPPTRTDGGGPLDKHPDENVTVLCDTNQESLDAAAARFPKASRFTDLRKVFDNPKAFDAVVVSSPTVRARRSSGTGRRCARATRRRPLRTSRVLSTAEAGTAS